MKRLFLTAAAAAMLAISGPAAAQADGKIIRHLEPSNWWVGMQCPGLQLMVHGRDIGKTEVSISYHGVEVRSVERVENPNYLFVNLRLADTVEPGSFDIVFSYNKRVVTRARYELKPRAQGSAQRAGFGPDDAIYLIMPDRFANGNTANDTLPTMLEGVHRDAPYGRHGGDLAGVEQHLDYIRQLGMTAIWLNPVQENNMPQSSYHGYAITDYYAVDARLGTLDEYKRLVDQCHAKGLKMIMDMVFNHCGTNHWWMKDLPMTDWLNSLDTYGRSSFRLSTVADPHVSKFDFYKTTRGWFDTSMADMNMANPYVQNYLIQNSIWWIETVGLDGIRQDTYPYPDKHGMARWQARLAQEYPNFNTVGEVWISQASKLCYWQKDFPASDGFNSNLPSLMDFPLQDAISRAFTEESGWSTGIMRLYDALADDYLYPNPDNMVVFGENHDVGRLLNLVGGKVENLKLATAFLATVRGIPQLYTGTEVLMAGNGFDGHCFIREDFAGGWPGDAADAFTAAGRTPEQNDMFDFTARLFNFRLHSEALRRGRLIHFLPVNDVYVYFRIAPEQTVMVILNNGTSRQTLNTADYAEVLAGFTSGTDVVSGHAIDSLSYLGIDGKTAMVIDLKR